MDSLLLKKIIEIKFLQDSLISETHNFQSSLSNIRTESFIIKILPFLGVIIGGLITYFGQYYLKNKDIKNAVVRDVRDTINTMFVNLSLLNFLLKELAYLEVDSKYQHHLSCIGSGENKKRALEEHYNDYKYIFEIRSKISNAISEVNSGFLTYYKFKKIKAPQEITDILQHFTSHILDLPRPKEYPNEKEVTTEILEKDISNWKNEYTKYIADIEKNIKNLE